MSKRRAFISGPFQGMEQDQSHRERIGRLLLEHEYEPIDPWQREKIVYSTTGRVMASPYQIRLDGFGT